MKAKHGLSDKTVESVRLVLRRYPEILRAILFGSRAKGTYKPGSDIDLALIGPDVTQQVVNHIYGELDDLPIPHTFSLIILSQVDDAEVLAHIDRVGIPFYEKASAPLKV
jgi:predicted nucleotidyltransferase